MTNIQIRKSNGKKVNEYGEADLPLEQMNRRVKIAYTLCHTFFMCGFLGSLLTLPAIGVPFIALQGEQSVSKWTFVTLFEVGVMLLVLLGSSLGKQIWYRMLLPEERDLFKDPREIEDDDPVGKMLGY